MRKTSPYSSDHFVKVPCGQSLSIWKTFPKKGSPQGPGGSLYFFLNRYFTKSVTKAMPRIVHRVTIFSPFYVAKYKCNQKLRNSNLVGGHTIIRYSTIQEKLTKHFNTTYMTRSENFLLFKKSYQKRFIRS